MADHRPPEEAGQTPLAEVAAQSRPGSFPLGRCPSLVSSYTGRRHSHASPKWSLGKPALQRAFQTFTATPADLHLLKPIHCPQLTAYAFTCVSGLVACPSASALYKGLSLCAHVLDIAKCLPSALSRRNALGTVVIHVGTSNISDRHSEVLKEHYQTLLDTTRKKTDASIVISGPLPTYRRGSERFSRLFALQFVLRDWYTFNGLGYVDNWSSFWEQPALYQRDWFHPSCLGSIVLSLNIKRAIH
ncbi:hypothetical protein AOLI_G00189280 [Acnodon oligacanthus]